MKSVSRKFLIAILILVSVTAPMWSQAKAPAKFPTKAIEVTCLFGPGSAADLIARKFSDMAQGVLGVPLPVVNRTGGGQAIGYTYVKGQKPDGYNVIWTSNGIFTAYYQGNIDFRLEAFKTIAQVSYEPVSLAVKYDAPWKTIEEFMTYMKANPGKLRIGNSGAGTFTHLTAAALENEAHSRVIHVPFGKGLAFASLLGGQIEATIQLPSEVEAQYKAKQVRILAVTGADRVKSLPDVPTLKESGYPLELILWRGLAVPKGTPDDVVKVLADATRKVVESDEFKKFADTVAIVPSFRSGPEFEAFLEADDKFTGLLMKQTGTSQR
jgi:tripartite-type tricarboxylate transporter receptor subunit TctC